MLDELRNECPKFVFLGNYSETQKDIDEIISKKSLKPAVILL